MEVGSRKEMEDGLGVSTVEGSWNFRRLRVRPLKRDSISRSNVWPNALLKAIAAKLLRNKVVTRQ